jgi:acetyltransferase-like isoleucine patch superfamily enzyme
MNVLKQLIKYLFGFFYWNLFNIINTTEVKNYLISIKSKIGKNVMIRKQTFIYGKITIGDYSYVSGPNTLVHDAIIGRYCSIARNVAIGPGNHNLSSVSTHPFLYSVKYKFITNNIKPLKNIPPIIGNDVWIGMNSTILNNVEIGDGAIIGAGSVVTKDVKPYSVVGGVPAKHIKFRFSDDIIKQLLEINWWNWDSNTIRDRIKDFDNIIEFIDKYGLKNK